MERARTFAEIDTDCLDCCICYRPLQPPIFQCDVGHVLCSRCSGTLGQARHCHKCRAPMPGGYRRSHDMETLVDSIRVQCPHAAHGCDARPVYHGRDAHARACPHAPCHCPGEACDFAGSTAALLDHIKAAHGWPCTAAPADKEVFSTNVFLRDGFNFYTENNLLFLLNMVPAPPFGRVITAVCIHPDRAATPTLTLTLMSNFRCTRTYTRHFQSSDIKVVCTDLSNGLPDPSSNCFMFVVPGSGPENKDATTLVFIKLLKP